MGPNGTISGFVSARCVDNIRQLGSFNFCFSTLPDPFVGSALVVLAPTPCLDFSFWPFKCVMWWLLAIEFGVSFICCDGTAIVSKRA